MKNINLIPALIFALLSGCNKVEINNDLTPNETETEMTIVRFNTTNVATGFETLFSGSRIDSAEKATILQKFINPIRFLKDKSGYFFAETWNGWMLAHPLSPAWVGTCRYDVRDTSGKFYVQDMINTARFSGYGFVEYVIEDPVDGFLKMKTGFVNAVPSIQGFIGSGLYHNNNSTYYSPIDSKKYMVEELTRTMADGLGGVLTNYCSDSIQRVDFCRKLIDHVRFFGDGSGYFFIYDLECKNVAHGYQKELEGMNLFNLQDSHDAFIIRDFASLVKSQGSGFYQYWWPDPATNTDEPKLAFLTIIPETSWFIGAGFYLLE